MNIKKVVIDKDKRLAPLSELAQPVYELYYRGDSFLDLLDRPMLAVVGSRKVSAYGRQVTQAITSELAKAGVVIISGLALGVDSIAHQAALEANGATITVLPCGIDKIYPSSHFHLAHSIVRQGGAVVSEYPVGSGSPMKYQFIARNRIIAGLAQGVLITEAATKSGSLHTADFALEQGKDIFAIPGNITSPTSTGTNNLIKNGAIPVTNAADILDVLGISTTVRNQTYIPQNNNESIIMSLILQDIGNPELLQHKSSLEPTLFNATLSCLEINGAIIQTNSGRWILA